MAYTMTRVPLRNLDDVEQSITPPLEHTQAASGGRLLNMHRQMATAPAVLAGYMGLRDALAAHAAVDGRTRAAIAVACSATDHGQYTLVLAVVREATSGDGSLSDDAWEAATTLGWSDTDLAETFAYIGLVLYCDRFVRYAATELDVAPTAQTAAA